MVRFFFGISDGWNWNLVLPADLKLLAKSRNKVGLMVKTGFNSALRAGPLPITFAA
jgi:hypothetical protein